MEQPTTINFSDISIPIMSLLPQMSCRRAYSINSTWFRVEFDIPDTYSAPSVISTWINTNLSDKWSSYVSGNHKNQSIMVVFFLDRNDAVMFKLQDGHRAYELTDTTTDLIF